MPAPFITAPTICEEYAGLIWQHGENAAYEFFYLEDAERRIWQVARRRGDDKPAWLATVAEPEADGRLRTLNVTGGDAGDDLLAHVGCTDPFALLSAMAPLIEAGTWPE